MPPRRPPAQASPARARHGQPFPARPRSLRRRVVWRIPKPPAAQAAAGHAAERGRRVAGPEVAASFEPNTWLWDRRHPPPAPHMSESTALPPILMPAPPRRFSRRAGASAAPRPAGAETLDDGRPAGRPAGRPRDVAAGCAVSRLPGLALGHRPGPENPDRAPSGGRRRRAWVQAPLPCQLLGAHWSRVIRQVPGWRQTPGRWF